MKKIQQIYTIEAKSIDELNCLVKRAIQQGDARDGGVYTTAQGSTGLFGGYIYPKFYQNMIKTTVYYDDLEIVAQKLEADERKRRKDEWISQISKSKVFGED